MEELDRKIEKAQAIIDRYKDELEPDEDEKRKLEVEHIEFNKKNMIYQVKKLINK